MKSLALRAKERARVRNRGVSVAHPHSKKHRHSHGTHSRIVRYPLIGSGYVGRFPGDVVGFGNWWKNIGRAVTKAVKDTGHTVGKVVTNKYVEGAVGTALAVTGVGLPLAAGIMAAEHGVGTLIKPGGNLGKAAKATLIGAGEGTAAWGAGKVLTHIPGVGGKVTAFRQKIGTAARVSKGKLDGAGGGSQTGGTRDGGLLDSIIPSRKTLARVAPTAAGVAVARQMAHGKGRQVVDRIEHALHIPSPSGVPRDGFPAIPATTGPDAQQDGLLVSRMGGTSDIPTPVLLGAALIAVVALSRR